VIREFLARLLIRNAITFEKSTEAFYRKGVEIVREPRARALLERAAEEERAHLARLKQLLEHVGEESICTRHTEELKKLELEHVAHDGKIRADSTPQDVLRAAIEQEKASYDFYYLLAQRAKLHTLKETFAAIAIEEHQHLDAMHRELEQLMAEK